MLTISSFERQVEHVLHAWVGFRCFPSFEGIRNYCRWLQRKGWHNEYVYLMHCLNFWTHYILHIHFHHTYFSRLKFYLNLNSYQNYFLFIFKAIKEYNSFNSWYDLFTNLWIDLVCYLISDYLYSEFK